MKHLPTHQPNRSRFALVFLLFMSLILGSTQGWGQIAQRGTATIGTNTSASVTIDKPTGVVQGDIMIANIANYCSSCTQSSSSLSGWTLIAGTDIERGRASLLYKIAGASEPASYTFAVTTSSTFAVGGIVAFSGVNSTTPFDVTPSSSWTTASNADITNIPTATTVTANTAVLIFGAAGRLTSTTNANFSNTNWTMTSPATLTELFDVGNNASNSSCVGAAWATKQVVGATGAGRVNCTVNTNPRLMGGIALALRPCLVVNAGTALSNICKGGTSAGLGGSVGGTATGGTWSDGGAGGSFSPNATTLNATYTPLSSYSGTVTLTLTTSGGSCGTATASKTLVVNPTPSSVTASSPTAAICSGQTINLTSSASSNSSTSVTPINQNFNTSISPWTAANASSGATTTAAAWTLRASGYNDGNETFTTSDGSQFIMSSSDAQGGGTTSTTLASASFSTTGLSAATISLNHYYRYNSGTDDRAFVEVSTNNSTWTALATYSSTQGSAASFATNNILLTSGFLDQATVYVRLRYTASFDWYWAVNSISVSGTYTSAPAATFAWTSSPAGYTSTTQSPANVATTVSATQSTIAYTVTATNNYGCSASATTASVTLNPTPVITATSPQTFCATPTPTVGNLNASVSISGATITWYNSNSYSNGSSASSINLGTSGSSFFAGSTVGSCNSALVPVVYTINPAASATISYAGAPFCKSVTTAQSATLTGTTGGTYSASPAGLTINASTGAVTPSTSTAGTYTVTYSVTLGGCSAFTATTSVTITALPTATISYAGSPFCNSDSNIKSVTLTGTTGGTFASAAGLSINSSTGAITPSTSTAGTYTVTYTMAAAGGCSAQTATASITISGPITAAAPSSSPTVRINSALTNITHTTTGATGISNAGVSGANGLPAGVSASWASNIITISGTPTVEGTFNYSIPVTGACASVNATGTITVVTYKSQFISANLGSANWCAGETREISVTIKNIGSATWADNAIGTQDVNIGVKWNSNGTCPGGNWCDYHVRTDAGGLAPGETGTITFTLTAANNTGTSYTTNLAAGNNNITFDLVYEGIFWFANNGSGNTVYSSSNQTINANASAPSATGSSRCGAGTVTLTATAGAGETVDWYANPTGGSPLLSGNNSFTTPNISSTTIYYAEDRNTTSGCVSTSRTAVTATINSFPTTTGVTICAGGSGSLSVTSSCDNLLGQTSGPRDATSGTNVTGVGTLAWTNPGNIAGAGTAGMIVNSGITTNYLQGVGYGFAIPTNATINGITLNIRKSSSGTTAPFLRDSEVKLVKGGVILSTNKAVSGTDWLNNNVLATVTYGGSTDLWNTTWTTAEINASNFGAVLAASNANTANSRTAAVDFMQITVTYTLPGSLNWYTASSGGSVISTGSTFNPVGVANSGLVNSNTPGTTPYYVSCSTAAGACRAQANFEIKELPTATVAAVNANICSGDAASFSLTGTSGASVNYTLNGTEGTAALTSGIVTVTVANATANQTLTLVSVTNPATTCSQILSANATITVNPILTASVSIASNDADNSLCAGTSVTFTATPTNGGTPSFQWKVNGTNVGTNSATFTSTTLTNNDVTTCVMTSNATPCLTGSPATSNAVTITVNPIVTPMFTQVAAICSGATLNALPTTSNNGIPGTWSPAMNNAATTEYTFTPSNGQCASTASMTITVNALPTATVTAGSATTFCQGGSVVLNAITGTGLTYLWSNGATTSSITVNASGSYTVTVTNANGCSATSSATPVTVTPATTYYADADGDSYGNAGSTQAACSQPSGYVTNNTDCNDNNNAVKPSASEVCNNIDDNCNGQIDEGASNTSVTSVTACNSYTWTANNTTYTASGSYTTGSGCNTQVLNLTVNAANLTYYTDNDQDNFGTGNGQNYCTNPGVGYSDNYLDCNDNNAAVNPEATESCANAIDDNCDGIINEEAGGSAITYYLDTDNDGSFSTTSVQMCAVPTGNYTTNSALALDCNDNNAAININAVEICGNNIDEDCAFGDLVPAYYTSRQSGPWTTASTWNKSCDNTTYDLALSAPQDNYAGIVTIAASHAVTVGTNDAYVASAGNLNINATGSLIVNGKMSLSQTLVNNGTLTVNNGSSFLQSSQTVVNTGNGAYVVNLNLTGTSANGTAPNGRYWYLGSPMNNTNIYNTFYNPSTMTRVWDYLPTTNAWNAIINSSTGVGVNSTTNMAVGIGYLYRAGSAQDVIFNGTSSTFNNNITAPLEFTGTGYKYVANPYTSHVDWRQVTRTGLNVSYWIRNAANTSYESFNATSGLSTNNISGLTNQFIPPMQGFWIYAYTTPCSLRMDNGDRVHAGNAIHAPEQNQVVRLNLNDGKTDDQALVYENENASNGIEEYDTDKFMDENHHQVYFLEGTKEVSMDGLKDATAKQRVDMGIQITSAGTYTINAVELGVEEDVVLEDKFNHTFQDLKRNSTYSFTTNAGTFNNRFVLHFTLNPQAETVIETETVGVTETEVEGVSVYTTTGQQVKVWVTNTAEFQNATVKVYDAIGNMIERKNMTSNELLLDLNTATGVYLVEVVGTEKTFTKKVFISK